METPELDELSKKCINYYSEIESFEVWTENLFDNTIRQLKCYINLERFNYISQSKLIYDQLFELIEKLNVACSAGLKLNTLDHKSGKLIVYENQIAFTSNLIVTENYDQYNTFLVTDNPNYIFTDDHSIGISHKNSIEQVSRHAIRLTDNSELVRMAFFSQLKNKLEQVYS